MLFRPTPHHAPLYRRRNRPRWKPFTGRVARINVSHSGDTFGELTSPLAEGIANIVIAKVPAGGGTEVKLIVNNGPVQTLTLPAGANAQFGSLFAGVRISAGAPQTGGELNAAALGIGYAPDEAVYATLIAAAQQILSPVITEGNITDTAGTEHTFDLATLIQDPSGAGYDITSAVLNDADEDVRIDLVGTVLTYFGPVATTFRVTFSVRTRHPVPASVSGILNVVLTTSVERFPNGALYSRDVSLQVIGGSANEFFDTILVPLRLDGDWVKSVANGGDIVYDNDILDIWTEYFDGTVIPIMPMDYDPVNGTAFLYAAIPWNARTQTEFRLFYGSTLTTPKHDRLGVFAEYHYFFNGWSADNFADITQPWIVQDITQVDGIQGKAGDFVLGTSAAGIDATVGMTGTEEVGLFISVKRAATGKDEGYLTIGDATTDNSALMTFRDDIASSGLTGNTLRGKMTISDGTVTWRGPENAQTTDWQTIQPSWRKDGFLRVSLNGVQTPTTLPTNNTRSGTLSATGALQLAVGANIANGRWDQLIDEIRISKFAPSDNRKFVEDQLARGLAVATIGPQQTVNEIPTKLSLRTDTYTVENLDAGLDILLDVLANDSVQPGGGTLTITSVSAATLGVTSIQSNQIRLQIAVGTSGVSSFFYTVTNGGITGSVGVKVIVLPAVVEPPPPPTTDLYLNPFNKRSATHRPVGAGAIHYIKGGVDIVDWNAGRRSTYQPDGALNDMSGLRDRIGDFILGSSEQGRKFQYLVDPADPFVTWNDIDSTETVRMRTPNLQLTRGGPLRYIPRFTGGDFENGFAPVDGITSPYMMQRFTDCDYEAKSYKSNNRYDLLLTDNAETAGPGTGGSNLKWPGMTLRGHDINDPNPGPINHAFNVAVTRHDNVLLDAPPEGIGRRAPEAHILNNDILWPASRVDSSVNPASSAWNINVGPFQNQGILPYGTLLVVRPQDRDELRALIGSSNLRGLRMLDAMIYYGCYTVDGHGQWVRREEDGRIQGVLQMRVDGLVGQDEFGRSIPNVVNQVNAALRAMIPFLYVVGNRLLHANLRAEDSPSGLPYHGGSKLLPSGQRQWVLDNNFPLRSLNNAYDAPAPGYQVTG